MMAELPHFHSHGTDSSTSFSGAAKFVEDSSHLENAPTEKKSDDFLVDFTPHDPGDPRNWPTWRKWLILLSLTVANFATLWNASGYSTIVNDFPMHFGTSREVAALPIALYVFGLAFGPMTLAPLSEYYGRTPIYLVSLFVSMLFMMATALVPTASGFIILRFFSGFFCSAAISQYPTRPCKWVIRPQSLKYN